MAVVVQVLIGETSAGQESFEPLLATPVGANRYRVERSPLMAGGIAREDTVLIEDGGRVYRIVEDAGYGVVQLYYRRDLRIEDLRNMEAALSDVGGVVDAHAARVLTVSLPPGASPGAVRGVLDGYLRRADFEWRYAKEPAER